MRRILVAEDNDLNARILVAMLKDLYAVERVKNGIEAIQRVVDETFDLVLMDLEMPELDGWEATRQLRALEQGLALPILAASAHVDSEDWETARLAGCNDYVSKPYVKDELLAKIAKHLP